MSLSDRSGARLAQNGSLPVLRLGIDFVRASSFHRANLSAAATGVKPHHNLRLPGFPARFRKVYYANTRKDAAKIDFDDDFIYREVRTPVSRRKISIRQLIRKETLAACAEESQTGRIG